MIIQTMKPFTKQEDWDKPLNPYQHDLIRQGKEGFNQFEIMVGTEKDGIIIVDKMTGERIMIKRNVIHI